MEEALVLLASPHKQQVIAPWVRIVLRKQHHSEGSGFKFYLEQSSQNFSMKDKHKSTKWINAYPLNTKSKVLYSNDLFVFIKRPDQNISVLNYYFFYKIKLRWHLLEHDGLPENKAFLQVCLIGHEQKPLSRDVHAYKVPLLSCHKAQFQSVIANS